MAEDSDKYIWLLTQETIRHHDHAKKCQHLIQELMWERGRIELAYIQSLEKWAQTLNQGIRSDDSPYPRQVQEVLVLPAREAEAQANQHQVLYNDILSPDGPCLQMRKLIQSLEESAMVSESNRVFSTAVSQYQALVQRRQELEGEVRRRKQHYDYSLTASREMDEHLDGPRRRKTSRPMSARKLENMESRRFHLKKYSDVQLSQFREQEADLDTFMKDQREPLESILSDLNLFSRRRLSDTVAMSKAYVHTLAQQEVEDNRERKRLTLMECERMLEGRSVTSLADLMITSLKERVKQIILTQNSPRFTLEDFVSPEEATKPPAAAAYHSPRGRPQTPGIDLQRFRPSAPLPDCPQNRLREGVSEGGIPAPPPPTYGRSQIARVSHLLQVQSLQDDLYKRGHNLDLVPSPSTGTMHVFYTSSSDSLLAKAGSAHPTASNSVDSDSSVETLTLPPENKVIPRDQLPFVVRNFCMEEEEEEAGESRSGNRLVTFGKEVRKRISKRDAVEENQSDQVTVTEIVELTPDQLVHELKAEPIITLDSDDVDDHMSYAQKGAPVIHRHNFPPGHPRHLRQQQSLSPRSRDVASPCSYTESSNCSTLNVDGDVTTMANVKVRALHPYFARNPNELTLERGQHVKQKLGSDDHGFSYGWTRLNKLGKKRYGYYPANMVELVPPQLNRFRQFDTQDHMPHMPYMPHMPHMPIQREHLERSSLLF